MKSLVFPSVCNRERRIDQDERTKPGSSMQKLWIEVFNPTENDKGKYTLEMFDGQETHKRSLDLSGQGSAVYMYTSNLTQTSHPSGDVLVPEIEII